MAFRVGDKVTHKLGFEGVVILVNTPELPETCDKPCRHCELRHETRRRAGRKLDTRVTYTLRRLEGRGVTQTAGLLEEELSLSSKADK